MRKRWLTAAFIASMLGLVAAGISISEYIHIQKAGLEQNSFCTINEVINCDVINASSYATLFGIPAAAWGFLFYLVVAVYALFIRASKTEKQGALSFLTALTLVGFVWSLRMAYVAWFVLHAVCLICISMYVIDIFLLVAILAAGRIGIKDRIKNTFSKKIISSALAAVIIFGIGYVFALSSVKDLSPTLSDADIETVVAAHFRQSLYDIKPEDIAKAPVWGNKDARITMVEFSDFQCPFCRVAAFNIVPYLNEFKNDVKFVFVNYPLDNSCNKYMQGPMHQNACLAARAGICATGKGKFWEYHADVFKNQNKISREMLLGLGDKYGLEKGWMDTCIDSPETVKHLEAEIELAHHIYLNATPSIFLNRRNLMHWRSPDILRKVIREELKRLK